MATSAVMVAAAIYLLIGPQGASAPPPAGVPTSNVEIRGGVQYITIDARGGYFPRKSVAEAGIPTKLVMRTEGTVDCSAALVIRAIDYQKVLARSGEEMIDLGIPKPGPFQGSCSMGMYGFTIDFQ